MAGSSGIISLHLTAASLEEIAKAHAAGDPAAKLTVTVDLREPSSFTEDDLEHAVRADPEANARFENWSLMTAEQIIGIIAGGLNPKPED
jgi:hypothetical protein